MILFNPETSVTISKINIRHPKTSHEMQGRAYKIFCTRLARHPQHAWYCIMHGIYLSSCYFHFPPQQKLYDEMVARTNNNIKLGRVPDHLRKHHKGFSEWELGASRSDHHTILQVQSIPSSYQHITNCQSYQSKAYNLQEHKSLRIIL